MQHPAYRRDSGELVGSFVGPNDRLLPLLSVSSGNRISCQINASSTRYSAAVGDLSPQWSARIDTTAPEVRG
jgi:hypothetical protein